jgi:hypothetical protein
MTNKSIKVDLSQVPKIKVRFLWHNNWWDGPLAGMCEYKDQMYHYHCHHENYKRTAKYWRKYGVFKLTPEELADELKWHQLFVEKVGDHFDCDEGRRRRSELKPYHLHHEFYDEFAKWERPQYEEHQDKAIGWFIIPFRSTI